MEFRYRFGAANATWAKCEEPHLGRGVNTYSTKVHWWDVLFETRKTIGQNWRA
jgi:hypothetical protein